MAKSRIHIQFKGSLHPVRTEPIDTDEAQRLLETTVSPNIGKPATIALPGAVISGKDVASAQLVRVRPAKHRRAGPR
jgi:hypothetical protein